jgi:hypothetical protein
LSAIANIFVDGFQLTQKSERTNSSKSLFEISSISLTGTPKKKRAKAYALLSTHATHVDLDGFQIISPDSMTQIGPFPSEKILVALFQELAKHLQFACIHLLKLLDPSEPEILVTIRSLDQTLVEWRKKYRAES